MPNFPNFNKIFNNRKIRSLYDTDKKIRWFSVVDLLAALRNTDYDTARNHWKQIKYKMSRQTEIFKYHQLRLPAKDGKQRFTDVMRYRDIIKLVQNLSAGLGTAFKKLIGRTAAKSDTMRKFFADAGNLGEPSLTELRTFTMQKILIA